MIIKNAGQTLVWNCSYFCGYRCQKLLVSHL